MHVSTAVLSDVLLLILILGPILTLLFSFHTGRERGMRSIGMTQFKLKSQLQEWLDLSTQKGIPIFLLIMSRAFMLSSAGSGGAAATASGGQQPHHTVASAKASDPEQVLKTSMSFLDSDTINEVVLNAAKEEEDSNDMRRRRLESIQFQKEVSFLFLLVPFLFCISN